MSVTATAEPDTAEERVAGLLLPGVASLGAGAVHAAAAVSHADHASAAAVFTALAALQLAWGAAALARSSRRLAAVGVALGGVAVGGWLLAKTTGLPLVAALAAPEPVQPADASAAVLAALAGLLSAGSLATPALLRALPAWPAVLGVWPAVLAVVALAVAGTVTAGTHRHAAEEHAASHVAAAGATGAAAHREPVPYDPTHPIDLGGVPGVTPQQQAAAENLVAVTVSRLPRWADADEAERAGFRSIGDGFTGTEHLVSQAFLHDDVILDPDRPESLVYDTSQGGRRLVAAMYMLRPGTGLDEVPDIGGALVQWHTHEDLCFTRTGRVAGITGADGACGGGLVKPVPSPMVHVWITPHRCGPFAALEGIAGGRIAEGQTRLCDHAHGTRS